LEVLSFIEPQGQFHDRVTHVAVAMIAFQVAGGKSNAGTAPGNAFYTDDNGKSFFRDDVCRVTPFDHNGKQAYRADVFRGADGKQFVGLIYRHTDNGRKEMEGYLPSKGKDSDGTMRRSIEQRGMQVKPVGGDDKSWVLNDDVTAERMQTSVKDATGKPAQMVNP
jgi:hypothetical protein